MLHSTFGRIAGLIWQVLNLALRRVVERLRTILSEGRVEKRTALLIENFQEQARSYFHLPACCACRPRCSIRKAVHVLVLCCQVPRLHRAL